MEETIFDKILAGETQADVVYEDDYVLAFRDINPQAPVHVIVIPRKKLRGIADAKESERDPLGGFIQGISRAAEALDLEESGYRVVFNNGRDALQTVPYIHAHILGGRRMKWPPG